MVEIPNALITKLDSLGPHFCRVYSERKKHPKPEEPWEKRPVGMDWNKQENLMHADDPRLQKWLQEGGNYGVVGGFGLVILDADIPEIKVLVEEHFPLTFTVESPGSAGWHCYFLCGLEKPIKLRDRDGKNVGDIQGPGKMVLGPNCIHPNGGIYKIVADQPLAQITREQLVDALKEYIVPDKVFQQVAETAKFEKNKGVNLSILDVIPLSGLKRQGEEYYGPHPIHGSDTGRNFHVNPTKNSWYCFRHGSGGGPLLWLAVSEGMITCEEAGPGALQGPLFKQVLKRADERGFVLIEEEAKEGVSGSQADKMVSLCLSHDPTLFHDQYKTPYIQIEIERSSPVKMNLTIKSRSIKSWLASLLWHFEGKAPGNEAINAAVNVLTAMAIFDGDEHLLYNRVAPADDGIWIDMSDATWRAIKVTADGWRIVENPPILFKRYAHQQPLIEPISGGDPWKFLEFVNVDKKDGNTRLTLICTIISFLIPLIPHVVLISYGIQGSGKTMLFTLIRSLIDPSSSPVLTLPRKEVEQIQQMAHNWCCFFDNVSNLPWWVSDTLCRAATGGGFTKRELYTDDQDIIYNFKRCIGLNGINIAAQRGDLLDRSLLIGFQDIPTRMRKDEKTLLAEFDQCKAEILGGFLDTLSKAIAIYPSVNPKDLFRMADFTKWGISIARALGFTETEFIEAYRSKVALQVEEAAHASPIATVLMDYLAQKKLLEDKDGWDGTPSELYVALAAQAKILGISTRQKAWPKAPQSLTRRLNELAPSLKALGWNVVTGIRTGKQGTRKVRIISSVSSVPSATLTEDILVEVKRWILKEKNGDGLIESDNLTEYLMNLNLNAEETFKRLKEEGFLVECAVLGKWQVIEADEEADDKADDTDGTDGILYTSNGPNLKEILLKLIVELKNDEEMTDILVLKELANEIHDMSFDEVDRLIDQMAREAVIYFPREGYIKKT